MGALQVFTSPSEAWIVQTPNLDLPASPLRETLPRPRETQDKALAWLHLGVDHSMLGGGLMAVKRHF